MMTARLHGVLLGMLYLSLPIACIYSACPEQCTCDTARHLVDCENTGLGRIPWDLPDPGGLKKMDLRRCKIPNVVAEIVSYANLEYIDLSHNEITRIDAGVFSSLPKLKYLYLNNNKIKHVQHDIFLGLPNLVVLDLSQNDIVSRLDGTFRDLTLLEELHLSANKLSDISAGAFQGLGYLRHLKLDDNHLRAIPTSALSSVTSLVSLNLNYNSISQISSHAFKENEELRELSLDFNKISEIDVYAFHDSATSKALHLEHLSLVSNQLTQVPTAAFLYLTAVIMLDISQNMITEIPADSLHTLPGLQTLHISAISSLTTVKSNAFAGLANLRDLHMQSNHNLRTIEKGAFRDTSSLKKLDLHANSLSALSEDLVDWHGLEYLDLRFNPLNCDCELDWLRRILVARNGSNLYLADNVRCDSPPELSTRRLYQLLPADLPCKDQVPKTKEHEFQDSILIAIMGSVGGVLVIAVIILMYKYRNSYITAYNPAMDIYRPHSRSVSRESGINELRPSLSESERERRGLPRSSLSSSGRPKRSGRKLQRKVTFSDDLPIEEKVEV